MRKKAIKQALKEKQGQKETNRIEKKQIVQNPMFCYEKNKKKSPSRKA